MLKKLWEWAEWLFFITIGCFALAFGILIIRILIRDSVLAAQVWSAIWDILKTLIGVFLGAFLAFKSNRRHREIDRDDSHLAIGNVTVVTLGAMRGMSRDYKNKALQMQADVLLKAPTAPPWAQMLPVSTVFDKSLYLDLKTISFLIETSDIDSLEAFNVVQHANVIFMALASLHEEHKSAMMELQDAMAKDPVVQKTNFATITKIQWESIEESLGFSLTRRAETLNQGLQEHFSKDNAVYENALSALSKALEKRFGAEKVRRLAFD